MDEITRDSFFDGCIRLTQPRRGYRYSIDAVILANGVNPKPGETLVDLGTGCGIIPLILAFRCPGLRIWGVELQAPLAAVAQENMRANHLASAVTVVCADMREVTPASVGAPVDIVVSNPPYRRGRSGRINPDPQRALARHEIAVTLPDLMCVSRRLLRTGGRLVMIYAADRSAELLCRMHAERIEPKRLRSIHSSDRHDASLILVEGVREGRPGLTIAPPLVVYAGDGSYTEDVKAMFRAPYGVDIQRQSG
jgi:tRNA1Val (adenine37-N6)-methyltransferase